MRDSSSATTMPSSSKSAKSVSAASEKSTDKSSSGNIKNPTASKNCGQKSYFERSFFT
jgi:hypothetical protein